jgi:hypothetical protein
MKLCSENLKCVLVVFLYYKNKEGQIVYIKYMQFTAIHLEVYDMPTAIQLNKDFSRCRSLF